MKKIAISIPVHIQSDVIEDQVKNIKRFIPNSTVFLHVSGDSPSLWNEIMQWQPKYDGFVFLNPQRFKTFKHDEAGEVTNLSSVHSSNVLFAKSVGNFDIMFFDTSNCMFVRKGIEQEFENYRCGIGGAITSPEEFISPEAVRKLRMVAEIKVTCKSPQEGMWGPMNAAIYFANKIKELEQKFGLIGWEEATLANLMINYDLSLLDSNTKQNAIYHDSSEGASVKREMIHKVRNGELPHVYSVKRVPRNINDATRVFIRELTKND